MAGKADEKFSDTTFAAFVPAAAVDEAVPVLLFQSGYGSSSASHQPLLQKIADAGYVCVVPDRTGDTAGGKSSPGELFAALQSGSPKPASDWNAMSTDGTHLAAALDWAKAQGGSINGQAMDLTKIAAGGFSMGGIECMLFASNCDEVSAAIVVSPSSGKFLEAVYCFDHADLMARVGAFKKPYLFISSDKDLGLPAAKECYEAASSPATVLVFKDEVLDNSMALTEETSIWSQAIAGAMPGLAQHFALATEKGVVADAPMVAFMDHHLKNKELGALCPEASVHEKESK